VIGECCPINLCNFYTGLGSELETNGPADADQWAFGIMGLWNNGPLD